MSDSLADPRYPLSGGVPFFMAERNIPYASTWTAVELEHLSGMLEQVISWDCDLANIRRIFAETSTFYEARRRYAGWLVYIHHTKSTSLSR